MRGMGKSGEGAGLGRENVTTYLSRSKSMNDVILCPKTIYPREKRMGPATQSLR